jgi:hypothetical protein
MANRIQLRRDTTANWENTNPVLADGEPGYDIVTNEVRVGDGSTTWTGLSGNVIGTGGGGGASTGNVTFSDTTVIGTTNLRLQPNIAESGSYLDVYLTVGPDIHLASSDGNLILGGDSAANVRLGTDGNVQIQALTGGTARTWTFGTDGNLTLPTGSTITEANIGQSDAVILTPANISFPDQQLRIYTTGGIGDGNHLHLTSGNLSVTELFLGDDNQYVKLGTAGNVIVGTPNSIPSGVANWNGDPLGGWDQMLYANLATTGGTGSGLTVDVAAGGDGYVSIEDITINTPGSGYTDGDVITIDNENSLPGTFTISVPTNNWTFGTDGRLAFPGTPVIDTDANNFDIIGAESVSLEANAVVNIYTDTGGSAYQWQFGTDGNLTMPQSGNLITSTGSLHSISLDLLKSIVASSSTWGEFQSNIAAL